MSATASGPAAGWPDTRGPAQRVGSAALASTVEGGPGRFPGALAAEWTKLWSLRSTWWCLAAATAVGLGITAIIALDGDALQPPLAASRWVALSMDSVQYAIVALAALTVTGEYATRTIHTTLQATPSRGAVLAAKAVVLATVTAGLGVALALVGAMVATTVAGVGVDVGDLVAAAGAVGLYAAAISLLALGLGTALRSTAGALTAVFLLLLPLPLVLRVSGVAALVSVADLLPGWAGQALMTGMTEIHPPLVAIGLLAGWAGAALLAGYLVLRQRDA